MAFVADICSLAVIRNDIMDRSQIIFTFLSVTILSGCKSYYIPVDHFRSHFANVDKDHLRIAKTRGPAGIITEYEANQIDTIKCTTKNGKEIVLRNGPSIETRITTVDGKRTIFYFDRLYASNDTLIGYRSRILGLPKRIPMTEIIKVEVQDGNKNYHYVESGK